MSDVDAIRYLASERDLEFVDLDTYGVDPAAGEILPGDLARRHHVLAVKRKFGTPVIATADPDDLYAQDSVRAAIGRDFISVVAAPEQIGEYLEQMFGGAAEDVAAIEDAATNGAGVDGRVAGLTPDLLTALTEGPLAVDSPPTEEVEATTVSDDEAAAPALPELAAEAADVSAAEAPSDPGTVPDGAPIGATDGGEVSETDPEPDDGVPVTVAETDVVEVSEVATPEPESETASAPRPSRRGKRRKTEAKENAKAPAREQAAEEAGTDTAAEEAGTDAAAEEAGTDIAAEDAPTDVVAEGSTPAVAGQRPDPFEDILDLHDGRGADPAVPDLLAAAPTALTEGAGDDPLFELPVMGGDDLAVLALSVQGEAISDGSDAPLDSTEETADLVAEAVATFQEQHHDELAVQDDDGSTATAHFPPLAKALVDGGRVSLEDMSAALDEHRLTGQSIARILTSQRLVTEADLMWGMAEEMGLEFVDLDTVGVDLAEAGTIPEATARHHNVMVIANEDGTPVVAASNPTDVFAMDDLRTIMGRNFIVVVATRSQISAYISRAFNSGADAADMAMEASLGIDNAQQEAGVDDIQSVTEEAPIVRYVNLLILQALNERASDIHIEPTASELRIRYRIDGVLHDVSTAPRTISGAVITRLKVMADMNIAEHRVPQDGRISLNVGAKGIDLRMATLPTIHGEKVVMRVLDKSSVVLGFADLGFDEDMLTTYESLYTKPYGTILVTGPTGSGKSTTLYTTLTALNSAEKNIITVEDPVEIPLKGVNQVQLNLKAGLNFASALRAILRSDPDIVLVGEIRDKETASIAIEAALTGHMVLATLHTNSASATPMRLIEMGIEPFLVTSSLSGALAQRLARRLCMHCKEAFEPTEAEIVAAGWSLKEAEEVGGITKVYRAVGCSACSHTGYRGRKALAELLSMTEEVERLIIEGGSVDEIHRLAVSQGMITLRQSGLMKAIEGETTLEEVLRVVA